MKDVVSDVLDTVALKGTLYFRTDFSPPFAIAVPSFRQAARFHLVVQGVCHVALPGGDTVTLQDGDLVLVPHGSAHVLTDAPGREAAPLEQVIAAAGFTGEGAFVLGAGDPQAATRMVCGHFAFADGADHPLLRALPPALHFTAADRAHLPMLDDILRLVGRRMFEAAPGAAASAARLSEVIFIEALRAGLDRAPELRRLLTAVDDPQIGRALSLIHAAVERDWTLDSLAAEAGMSRTRFAERFRSMVGSAPMGYLSGWRLQKARALLSEPRASVKEVAHKTGYASPAAFSRAYSNHFGHPPRGERARTG